MSFPNYISEKTKSRMRVISPESSFYSHIDQKCNFCKVKLEKKDGVFPNRVMEAQNGEIAVHGNCLEYVLKKYPDVPISELAGKIIRVRVEHARL